jgi:hypothetical protein
MFFNNTEVRPEDENISLESKYDRGDHYDARMDLLCGGLDTTPQVTS